MNSLTSKRLEDIFAKGLEDALKTFLQDFLKMSWRRLENVFWRRLGDALKTLPEDVLKTSRMTKANILVLTKTSWRRLQDVFWRAWLRRIYLSSSRSLEEVLKTSSEDEDERHLQDVFIKINVYWDKFYFCLKKYVIRFSPSSSTLLIPKKLIVMMRFYTSSKPFTNF